MEKFKKSVKKDQNTEFSALFGGGVIENRPWDEIEIDQKWVF